MLLCTHYGHCSFNCWTFHCADLLTRVKNDTDDYILLLFLSEFPSSQLELEAVADIFDKRKNGIIDYKQFMASLRTDAEKEVRTVYLLAGAPDYCMLIPYICLMLTPAEPPSPCTLSDSSYDYLMCMY